MIKQGLFPLSLSLGLLDLCLLLGRFNLGYDRCWFRRSGLFLFFLLLFILFHDRLLFLWFGGGWLRYGCRCKLLLFGFNISCHLLFPVVNSGFFILDQIFQLLRLSVLKLSTFLLLLF